MTDCFSPLNPVPPACQKLWHRARDVLLLSLSLLIATAAHAAENTLLIAPMIGGLDSCFFKLAELKHSVTRYRITLKCFTAEAVSGELRSDGDWQWVSSNDFGDYPLSVTGRTFAKLLAESLF